MQIGKLGVKGTLTTVYTRCAEPLTAPCRKTGCSNACVCACVRGQLFEKFGMYS